MNKRNRIAFCPVCRARLGSLQQAAPDLLAALEKCEFELSTWLACCDAKEIRDSFQGMASTLKKTRAAIAKAKGEA